MHVYCDTHGKPLGLPKWVFSRGALSARQTHTVEASDGACFRGLALVSARLSPTRPV